ncbi:MAG: poly(3-hydroxybutyrate) depolymerase [Proteobacteria bacterium]|nr:poly(3-hydroxybutyrate) depolymerase [Pseudomonadota bacterium]
MIMIKYRYLVIVLFTSVISACSREPVELGTASYHADGAARCTISDHHGTAGAHDSESSPAGIRYSVRTPANYDGAVAHPLLVVYPGAGQSRLASERFTGFTKAATAAGFVVAYTDHRRLSLKVLDELARIPTQIASKWCVDTQRIFLSGHSDGGTAASAIAFQKDHGLSPRAIAPSAAGLRGADLEAYSCPPPLSVMVLHNTDDELFPGFGAQAAKWWASCNGCDLINAVRDHDGCIEYAQCANKVAVSYCEHPGGHRIWPEVNDRIIDFFSASSNKTKR